MLPFVSLFLAACFFVTDKDWSTLTDRDGDGYQDAGIDGGDDCDDSDPEIHPGATEVCNGGDDNCDGLVDLDDPSVVPAWTDEDGDGHGDAASPGCPGTSGYVDNDADCDDADAAIHPEAPESCNGFDDDCDNLVDDADPGTGTSWYPDLDQDGFGDSGDPVVACDAPSGRIADGTDCDDGDYTVFPGAPELCDGADNDCDDHIDNDVQDVPWYRDADADDWGSAADTITSCSQPEGYAYRSGDCDDGIAAIHPGAPETCDGFDDDCDGLVDGDDPDMAGDGTWYIDEDGDGHGVMDESLVQCAPPKGYVLDADDCDDADASVYSHASERCDERDNDCDGSIDEDPTDAPSWYADTDGDGYGVDSEVLSGCVAPSGYVADPGDCAPDDPGIHPDTPEICDGVDNDCNGSSDVAAIDALTWYNDADGDGFGDGADVVTACEAPGGFIAYGGDCAPQDPAISPDAPEICNGLDDDCDGSTDVGAINTPTWFGDTDRDGFGDDADVVVACVAPTDFVVGSGDCDDSDASVSPGSPEHCDGIDDDCDGQVDEPDAIDAPIWSVDADGDGYGDLLSVQASCTMIAGTTDVGGDCDDADGDIHPGAPELCDAFDTDCDGLTDDPESTNAHLWYPDTDGDGYGDREAAVLACTRPSGAVTDASDCDDTDAQTYPGATEIGGDRIDQNCDGIYYAEVDIDSTHDIQIRAEGSGDLEAFFRAGPLVVDDLDGDSTNDLLIGAPMLSPGATEAGAAYLVSGPLTVGLNLNLRDADVRLTGSASEHAGTFITSVGDLDGNSWNDLLVGTFTNGTSTWVDGNSTTYIVYGPVAQDQSLSSSGGQWSEWGYMPYPPVRTGDVNGDGFDDFAEGTTCCGSVGSAAISIVFGPASGAHDIRTDADLLFTGYTEAAFGDVDGDGHVDMATPGPNYWYSSTLYLGPLTSASSSGTFTNGAGFVMGTGIDDIDGDSTSDIIFYGYDCGQSGCGNSTLSLLYGPVTGSYDLTLDADATISLDELADLYHLPVSSDADGDGLSDLFLGLQDSKSALLIPGPFAGSMRQDVDASWLFECAISQYNYYPQLALGDIDSDGISDILMGDGLSNVYGIFGGP